MSPTTASPHSPLPIPIPPTLDLTAPPKSDIWRKPGSSSTFSSVTSPLTDSFNAPILYRALPSLANFKSASVTVEARWKTLYDQGGLVLVWGNGKARKWVKTGIELTHGKPHISTVACDRWADWSLLPLSSGNTATVRMEREIVNGNPTSTLWVYAIEGEGGEQRPLREVTWVFEGLGAESLGDADDGREVGGENGCWVGVYAAKPKEDEKKDGGGNGVGDKGDGLEVRFEGLKIETF